MRKEEGTYRPHGRNRGVRQTQANAKWPLGVSRRNIEHPIDTQRACSLSIKMNQPPYWLASRGIDQSDGESLSEHNNVREEFI